MLLPKNLKIRKPYKHEQRIEEAVQKRAQEAQISITNL